MSCPGQRTRDFLRPRSALWAGRSAFIVGGIVEIRAKKRLTYLEIPPCPACVPTFVARTAVMRRVDLNHPVQAYETCILPLNLRRNFAGVSAFASTVSTGDLHLLTDPAPQR